MRENLKILGDTDRAIIRRLPWTTYAAFFSNLFNLALVVEPFLFCTLWFATQDGDNRAIAMTTLACWVLFFKIVKSLGHLRRHPSDWIYVVPLIIFTYYHSIIKLRAWLTRNSVKWEGRKIANVAKKDS